MKSKNSKKDKRNIFDLLCTENEEGLIKYIENNPEALYRLKNGYNPLMYALKNFNDNIIKLLIDDRNINQKNDYGDTSLMYALKYNHNLNENIINLLINDRAKNQKDKLGNTPLIIALEEKT